MRPRLFWPLSALLAWAGTWALFWTLRAAGASALAALVAGTVLGVVCSVWGGTWWRRSLIGLGFPLSLALSGVVALPAWAWLMPLLLLLLVYPINSWRDAPLFPTPHGALDKLADLAPLPPGARMLDAGCGLGQGMQALRRAYPRADVYGLEWSRLLRLLCAWRCPWATVTQGDIWRADWSGYSLVYLFQRPESMARALAKARAELRPGAWLVSLEFPVAGEVPTGRLEGVQGRPVWLYQMH